MIIKLNKKIGCSFGNGTMYDLEKVKSNKIVDYLGLWESNLSVVSVDKSRRYRISKDLEDKLGVFKNFYVVGYEIEENYLTDCRQFIQVNLKTLDVKNKRNKYIGVRVGVKLKSSGDIGDYRYGNLKYCYKVEILDLLKDNLIDKEGELVGDISGEGKIEYPFGISKDSLIRDLTKVNSWVFKREYDLVKRGIYDSHGIHRWYKGFLDINVRLNVGGRVIEEGIYLISYGAFGIVVDSDLNFRHLVLIDRLVGKDLSVKEVLYSLSDSM